MIDQPGVNGQLHCGSRTTALGASLWSHHRGGRGLGQVAATCRTDFVRIEVYQVTLLSLETDYLNNVFKKCKHMNDFMDF